MCQQGLLSILQEVEVNSIPLNHVAYLGKIWLTSFDGSVCLNYSPVGHAPECQLPLLTRITFRSIADTHFWQTVSEKIFDFGSK